jgi:hypothetical protein
MAFIKPEYLLIVNYFREKQHHGLRRIVTVAIYGVIFFHLLMALLFWIIAGDLNSSALIEEMGLSLKYGS